jgi:thymidylate synthase
MIYKNVADIRAEFCRKYRANEIVHNETGSLSGSDTIEIVGASFIADEPSIFGKVNEEYVQREIDWYNSMSLNVNDIAGVTPKIWKAVADKDGFINSNYGYLVFSLQNGLQYVNALTALIDNPSTRRATMVYTRPTIHQDWNKGGMSDFICTNAVQYLIRDNKLEVVVQMRSADSVFGYKNDRAWAAYVQNKLIEDLKRIGNIEVTAGNIYWQVASLHIYSCHFNLIEDFMKSVEQRLYA